MNTLLRLICPVPPMPPRPPLAPEAPADDDAPPRGCGWFDSSHELQAGLLVTEHASADAVANDLPLGLWLALHLAGAAPRPAAASCGE